MVAVILLYAMFVLFIAGLIAFMQLISLFIEYFADLTSEYFINKWEARKLNKHQL